MNMPDVRGTSSVCLKCGGFLMLAALMVVGPPEAKAWTPPSVGPSVLFFRVLFGNQSYDLIGSSRMHLPWEITGVQVTFSEPITTADVNSLSGVSTTGFSGLGTSTLTWSISPIAIGSFSATLAGSGPDAIKDSSGSTISGGAGYSQSFKVLWGDLNDDGKVNASDLTLENNARLQSYSIFADLNGDGIVDLNDVQIVRLRMGTSQQ